MKFWDIVLVGLLVVVVVGFIADAIRRAMGPVNTDGQEPGTSRDDVLLDQAVAAYAAELIRLDPSCPLAVMSEIERTPHIRGFVFQARALQPVIQKGLPSTFNYGLVLKRNCKAAKAELDTLRAAVARAQLDFDKIAQIAGLNPKHVAFIEKDKSCFELQFPSKM